jgi:hypothetical protein
MHARTVRTLLLRSKSWTESFRIVFEPSVESSSNLTGFAGEFDFEFTPLNGPVVAWKDYDSYECAVAPNDWPLVVPDVPPVLLQGESAMEGHPDGFFWQVMERSAGPSLNDTLVTLSKVLRKLSRAEVLAFQGSLWRTAKVLVDTRSCRWAAASLAIIVSRERYDRSLDSSTIITDPHYFEFEDLLDLAEIALAETIRLPDGTTARSISRDPTPQIPEGFDRSRLHESFGMIVPEWEILPVRWEGWRAPCVDDSGLLDVCVVSNRPWGQGLSQAAAAVKDRIEGSGVSSVGPLQVVFPEIANPGHRMAPFFHARHAGAFKK